MAYNYQLAPVREAFESYIDTEIPNVNSNVFRCSDYETHKDDWSKYETIRAMTTAINWKSNIGGSDTTHNFRVKLDVDLKRGDYIYDPVTGNIGLITWYVDSMPDCKKTQVSLCNVMTDITRVVPQVLDNDARVVTEAHEETIVSDYPCVYTAMYGRFDYEMRQNAPGIFPDQKIEVKIQYNAETKKIQSGDFMMIHDIQYRVMFASYASVDMNETRGFILLTCERVA